MSTQLHPKVQPHVMGFIARLKSLKLSEQQLKAILAHLVVNIDIMIEGKKTNAKEKDQSTPAVRNVRQSLRTASRYRWLSANLKVGDVVRIDGNPTNWIVTLIALDASGQWLIAALQSEKTHTRTRETLLTNIRMIKISDKFVDVYKSAVGAL